LLSVESFKAWELLSKAPKFSYQYKRIKNTFEDLENGIATKAILAAKNADVDKINEKVLEIFAETTREKFIFKSADKIVNGTEDENLLYSPEFLNRQIISGLPPHKLEVSVGCTLMLLRNINPTQGLYNGTRLKLLAATPRMMRCEIITQGKYQGNQVIIPGIKLMPTEEGQTLNRVGIYLKEDVFSHGQLYVAVSRASGKAKKNPRTRSS
jgi:hypothetical protein